MNKRINRITVLLGLGVAVLGGVATPSKAQEKEVHRVVTTLDKNDKSVALFDSMVPLKVGAAGEGSATIWATENGPADFSWNVDRSAARKGFGPPKGGTDLLIVELPPLGPGVDKLDMNTMMNVCFRTLSLRPVRKRKLVDEARGEWGVSIRRACRVFGWRADPNVASHRCVCNAYALHVQPHPAILVLLGQVYSVGVPIRM